MKKINAQLPGAVFLGLLITGSLFQSSGALAQQIAFEEIFLEKFRLNPTDRAIGFEF